MARKAFFSFQFSEDNWRANVVRNSWVTKDRKSAGFFDSAEWEKVKKQTDAEIKKWIDGQLSGCSVTVVLVGSKTYKSKWVKYEIEKSIELGKGLLEIDISKIKNKDGKTSTKGDWMLSSSYKSYRWNKDDGYNNMGDWIETAAKAAGR
ncbi:TIR domain-containing protein [Shewanella marisflavi]|uniref:TIR domain-containing protein n=1 Tax=Shewanella marisflavi TaxID=260364 RepID=UPI003AAAA4AE